MMTRRMPLFLPAVLAFALALSSGAKADVDLTLSDNSGGTGSGTVLSPTESIFSGTVGNFLVTLTAVTSNAPGAATATLEITNLSVSLIPGATLVAGGDTLTINAVGTDYSLPSGTPLTLQSTGSVTFTNSNVGDSMAFNSWLDPNNGSSPGVGTPAGSSSVTSTGGTVSASLPTTTASVGRPNTDFSMSNTTTITIVAVNDSSIETTGTTTALGPNVSSVPEPSSLAIAGVGALGLIGFGLRRRKALGA
jgi:hypothetical protein